MRDVRVLARWPEWQEFRSQLLAAGKVNETALQKIEMTTEVDSLEFVELTMALEETWDFEFKHSSKNAGPKHIRS
jgi:acyl carrier protein